MLVDGYVGEVIFHEVGHHIHTTKVAEHKDRERVARRWGGRLCGRYYIRRYWYLMPLAIVLWCLHQSYCYFKDKFATGSKEAKTG